MYQHASRALHLLILVLVVILFGTCASSVYFINDEPPAAAVLDNSVILTSIPRNDGDYPAFLADDSNAVTPPATFPPTTVPVVPLVVDQVADTTPDAGWSRIRPGLERRVTQVYGDQNQIVETLYVWRLDQKYFRLDVAFEAAPKSLETWQRESNALMVVNGGFYSIDNERYFPDGLTILNGAASGRSFTSGGMLAIEASRAELRWLVQEPYDTGEKLQAALQSFPILVQPGGGLGYGADRESNATARRTVIGQDRQGRILFMVAPLGYFTLHRLSAYLTASDLDLDIAINLDGGGSTGILVADPLEIVPTTRPIPFVILVYPR